MTNPYLPLVAASVLAFATCGCSGLDNCPDGTDNPIPATGGTTDEESLVFTSSPWDSMLTPFPAKSKVSFEHGLGVTPYLTKAYLSFAESGTNSKGGGSVSEVAGNESLIDCVDAKVVVLRNDTCEKGFFVRVVAVAAPAGDTRITCGL